MLNKILNFFFRRGRGKKVDNITSSSFENGFGIYDKRAQVNEWINIYEGNPSWLNNKVKKSLNIGALVASDLARLATIEFESSVSGEGVEDVNLWYQTVVDNMRRIMEFTIVQGGLALKPYIENDFIYTEIIPGDEFVPLKFDGAGNVTSAVFIYKTTQGRDKFTRLEFHGFDDDNRYVVTNKAFRSRGGKEYGQEVDLTLIDEWAHLESEAILDVNRPLFVYLTTPYANNKDIKSPLGVSVFTKIGHLLEDADRQWANIDMEYEKKKVRIMLSNNMVPFMGDMSEMSDDIDDIKDLFILFENEESRIDVFSPEIRDESMFARLEEIKRMIEFSAGLAYGSLSKVDNVEKTAEEIRSGKERSFNTVRDMQKSLKKALSELVEVLVIMGQEAGLVGEVDYETTFYFDDSIVIDEMSDITLMYQEVKDGVLKPEYYISRRYGITMDEARKRMGKLFSDEPEFRNEKIEEKEDIIDNNDSNIDNNDKNDED